MRSWFSSGLLAASLMFAPVGFAAAETSSVTFLLVNDIHKMNVSAERGGFARLATIVRAEKAANENVVFVHAGDTISPTLLSSFDQGEHVIDLLNMEPPDYFVPGNHEFDFGPDVFLERMNELTSAKMGANLRDETGAPIDGFIDTVMLEAGDAKIGLIGLAAHNAYVKSSPGDLQIAEGPATALAQAEALRAEGADLIVVLTHSDRAEDFELYRSGAFDLILSGDDHDLMVRYNERTAMVESSEEGKFVTAVDLAITIEEDGDDRDVEWRPNFRIIDSATFEPAADVAARVAEYEAELSKELDVALGVTETELVTLRASVRTEETAFGNLVADAMREAVDADIGITNGGGIRGNTTYAAGTEISRRDILTELPFGNSTVKLEMTGAAVLAALENGFSAVENVSGRFPQVSGVTVTVDLDKPAGERVLSVLVGESPLDEDATYTLATNDYMGNGGDGYSMLGEATQLLSAIDTQLMANDVMVFVRRNAPISATVEGRIVME